MAVERFTYDRLLGVVDKYKVIDLYPYKMKDVNNYIFRDHIPYSETSEESRIYARETHRKIAEGLWVNDNGTWVWMMPKLFTYINLGTVDATPEGAKARKEIYPNLRDNELIGFSYIASCDGFSGFIDDPDFTCNIGIRDLEDGVELSPYRLKALERHCRRKDGTWKKYVEAWDYLTWFYHHVNPRPFPLGKPLYENETYNGLWLGSRGIGKTYILFGGDATHEYWTGGAMYYEELRDKPKVNMMVGATTSRYLGTAIEAVRVSFTNMPGTDFSPHPYFTKTATNDWLGDRGVIEQIGRRDDGTYYGSRSRIGKAVIPINSPEVVVSTRSKRFYLDEIGLVENAKKVFDAADATLSSPDGKFGCLFGSGTGGNLDKILETQTLFTTPNENKIYAIPNYWHDMALQGLFMPASYKLSEYKKNGNTMLMEATKAILKERDTISGGDITKQTGKRMNEPLEPREMFLSGKSDYFDLETVIDRIDVLNPTSKDGILRKIAKIYELELGEPTSDGNRDTYQILATISDKESDWNQVILDYRNQANKEGRLLVFEPPMGDGREFLDYNNLYKVVYDPKSDLETGQSFACIKVWKGKPERGLGPGELVNNIVATAKVKHEEAHKLFLMLCLWYRAKGQYERNVSGIPDYFTKFGLKWLLQFTPISYIRDVTPGSRQSQETGIFITDTAAGREVVGLKREGLKALRRLHKSTANVDVTGRKFKHCEYWYDVSLLSEMNFFDHEGNFDDISAMIILMLWLEAEYMPDASKFAGDSGYSDAGWDDLAGAAKRYIS